MRGRRQRRREAGQQRNVPHNQSRGRQELRLDSPQRRTDKDSRVSHSSPHSSGLTPPRLTPPAGAEVNRRGEGRKEGRTHSGDDLESAEVRR